MQQRRDIYNLLGVRVSRVEGSILLLIALTRWSWDFCGARTVSSRNRSSPGS